MLTADQARDLIKESREIEVSVGAALLAVERVARAGGGSTKVVPYNIHGSKLTGHKLSSVVVELRVLGYTVKDELFGLDISWEKEEWV